MNTDVNILLRTQDFSIKRRDGQNWIPVILPTKLLVKNGECTGIIGESGCGKSVFLKAVFGILDPRKWKAEGKIFFQGEQLPVFDDKKMDAFRGSRMTMIVQDPLSAFDPRMTIGAHFMEGCRRRDRAGCRQSAVRQMIRMDLENPERIMESYPFQLSGGMLQRVLIALSLSSNPQLLAADEPTTALDSTVQAEILSLIRQMQKEKGISLLMVSHDLEVIEKMADMVYVMYAGQIVESGPLEEVAGHPCHPYTKGLLQSRPAFSKERLKVLKGISVNAGKANPRACSFAPRCPQCRSVCLEQMPELAEVSNGHFCRCIYGGDR